MRRVLYESTDKFRASNQNYRTLHNPRRMVFGTAQRESLDASQEQPNSRALKTNLEVGNCLSRGTKIAPNVAQ